MAECQHITLIYALNEDQLEAQVLRRREAQVGSGEVSLQGGQGHLRLSSLPSAAVTDYEVPV